VPLPDKFKQYEGEKMKRKISSMFLVLCMLVGLIPAFTLPASAAGSGTTIRTTTLDLTGAVTDSSSASEGWSWVYGTKTLTLNGVNIQVASAGSDGYSYGIKLPKNATITLADGSVNTVRSADVSADNKSSYGIFFAAPLEDSTNTINGTGTLFATGGSATWSFGICTQEAGYWGTINITSGTIYATGGTATFLSSGISTGLAITISGGTVIATGGTSSNYSSGISTGNGDVTISGGAVTATGGSASTASYGVQACLSIKISGGTVTATGGSVTSGSSYGLDAFNKDFIITGGTVSATGGNATTASYGICAENGAKANFNGICYKLYYLHRHSCSRWCSHKLRCHCADSKCSCNKYSQNDHA
jgi:hypothetical protein